MALDPTLSKIIALALVPAAIAAWWTAFRLWVGDGGVYAQARKSFPRVADILFGRVTQAPENRADAPMNDGLVLKRKKGKTFWILNRRMSDEQYDRLTR